MTDDSWLDDWERSPEEWLTALLNPGGDRQHPGTPHQLAVVAALLADGLVVDDGRAVVVEVPAESRKHARWGPHILAAMGYSVVVGCGRWDITPGPDWMDYGEVIYG